jgi:hypothetical protein
MDLLPKTNESHNNGPAWPTLHYVEHHRSFGKRASLLALHLLAVPSTLGFIENYNVLWGEVIWRPECVMVEKRVDVLNECRDFSLAI